MNQYGLILKEGRPELLLQGTPLAGKTFVCNPIDAANLSRRRKRVVSEKGYFIEWNNDFKDAREKIYGKKKNYKKAFEILLEQSDTNILATYELGNIYKYGRGVDIDLETSETYAADALKQLKENRFKLKGRPYVMRSLKISIGNLKSVLKSEKEKAFNMKIYKENERNAEMNAKKEQESEVL